MKKVIISSFLATLLILQISCKKTFLNEKPLGIIAADNLYVSQDGFEAGLNGLYALWRQERRGIEGPSNSLPLAAAVIGVDNAFSLYPGTDGDNTFNDFGIRLNSNSAYVGNLFSYLYTVINSANTLIGRSETVKLNWTDSQKNQIVGEARLIRAWAYRHLVNLYGPVPLSLTESTGVKTDYQRAPVAEIRKAMEADWLFAEANLTDLPSAPGRASKVVAEHYLSELYLEIGQYQKAKDMALAVINNTNYKLMTARYGVNKNNPGTPFTDMFLDGNSTREQGNTEVLWVMPNEYLSTGSETNLMRRWWVNRYNDITITVGSKSYKPITYSKENGGRGIGRFAATKFAFSLYANGDDRGSKYAWRFAYQMNNPKSLPTGSNSIATCVKPGYTGGTLSDSVKLSIDCSEPLPTANYKQNWPSTRKWDNAPDDPADVQNTSTFNDQIYLRLGETYLLLAEAQLGLKDFDGAATTLTTLRARSHASAVVGSQVNIDFILDERSRELFSEEPRRYALRRAHKWFERTQMHNIYSGSLIALRDTLLPIPQSVINANLGKPMDNNPGYN
nr:RagB/SusD family nutrient uptake outer membrane protein [uncultured Pedobacter sp.]